MAFSDRVPDALACALLERGYSDLTPVQRAVLGVAPATRDMLVSAETGSGKTLAVGLALAGRLLGPEGKALASGAPRAMVITPTRELALQVQGELAWLYAATGARIVCCTGGMDMRVERGRLADGCAVVVGSPGRLRDHLERGAIDASLIGCVALDEADDMLHRGFRDDLEFLLRAAAPDRQTLMFSATVTPRIEALAALFQRDAARVDAATVGGGADIRFEAVAVAPSDRENAVVNLLRVHDARAALVFCGRREAVGILVSRLDSRGFKVVGLSGAMPQSERGAALAAMRDGRARVCVATDLAARGLDLPGLELVIHADLPASEAALTHRSGRTGRAGRAGRAVLVVPHPERGRAEALARRAGVAIVWVPAPGPDAVRAGDEARLLAAAALDGTPIGAEERARAARLLARHDAEQVAVAYLRQYAQMLPAPEALSTLDPAALARPRLKNGVAFTLNRGRAHDADARRLLPLICRIGGLSRYDVGRIVVMERETWFEIAADAAAVFAAAAALPGVQVEVRRATGPAPSRALRGGTSPQH